MSKRSKAQRDDLIRSMEGVAVLKEPGSKPAPPAEPKTGSLSINLACGLVAVSGIAAGLWLPFR